MHLYGGSLYLPLVCLFFPFGNIWCFENKFHDLRNVLNKINDEKNGLEFSCFEDVVNRATTCWHHHHIIAGRGAHSQRAPFSQPPLWLNDLWVCILTLAERQGILLKHLLKRGGVGLPILSPAAWNLDVTAGTPTAVTSRL